MLIRPVPGVHLWSFALPVKMPGGPAERRGVRGAARESSWPCHGPFPRAV